MAIESCPTATPEYRTLISLTAELRLAVQSNLVPLSDSLKAEYLISPENASHLRNPMHPEADRAATLVDIIQNKVKQNSQHYHTFVRILESQGRNYYNDILSRLSVVYQEHGGTSQHFHRTGICISLTSMFNVIRPHQTRL